MTMKTILAPNAPWYDLNDVIRPIMPVKPPPKPAKRTHRAKPSDIDKKFEAWLSSIERIKK